ncbi:MAG: type VI secretion system ImpA family N-terminal domain-containing protein [Deltaproteobacteria bacterium]|jgi:predicted component of type VI protein secretion system|nr:type VI secretion system ImpA family N-terminal domain-containing protein [Deltaproteobacteria bacterium]
MATALSIKPKSSPPVPKLSPVRADPRFELIRREINSPNDILHPTHEPDWALIGELAEPLLADKGPDFLVALWLTMSRVRLGLWAGLYDGLVYLTALFRGSWADMDPPPERLASRQNLLRWWESEVAAFLRSKLPTARALGPEFTERLLEKIDALAATVAVLEPQWEPGFWSIRAVVAEWPAKGDQAPVAALCLVPSPKAASAQTEPFSLPPAKKKRGRTGLALALAGIAALLAPFVIEPWAIWGPAPSPPAVLSPPALAPERPSLALAQSQDVAPPPGPIVPCPQGQGQGEILASWAQAQEPGQLWVYLTYRGQLGAYAARSELTAGQPVTAVDFAGSYRLAKSLRASLGLGSSGSLAVGLHPGFVRVAVNYPRDRIPGEALAEVFCFRLGPAQGQGLAAIRLTFPAEPALSLLGANP